MENSPVVKCAPFMGRVTIPHRSVVSLPRTRVVRRVRGLRPNPPIHHLANYPTMPLYRLIMCSKSPSHLGVVGGVYVGHGCGPRPWVCGMVVCVCGRYLCVVLCVVGTYVLCGRYLCVVWSVPMCCVVCGWSLWSVSDDLPQSPSPTKVSLT